MFEILCFAVLPVMIVMYVLIQRLVAHHSSAETWVMFEELVVEAMNKHDRDFDD